MDDDKFVINIEIAGKEYSLTIPRQEEELVRSAAKQINRQILRYRQHFTTEVDMKDLLAMVTLQLSIDNLQLEARNDTVPFTETIQRLTSELEMYMR